MSFLANIKQAVNVIEKNWTREEKMRRAQRVKKIN